MPLRPAPVIPHCFPKCLFSSILPDPHSAVSLFCIHAHCPPTGSTQLPSLVIYPTVPLESSLLTPLVSSLNVASTSWTPMKVDTSLRAPLFLHRRLHIPPLLHRLQIAEMMFSFPTCFCTIASSHLIQKSLVTTIHGMELFLLLPFFVAMM